jgi:hypothetical protein
VGEGERGGLGKEFLGSELKKFGVFFSDRIGSIFVR